ncbi:hypothetical protein BJY04DRAFT_213996 [Aspergillus karnatakaensis]|uniref:uncharacterized protein n=1 Tax=Aspergillus karnatakaensis TaxID=1810916 RepID=UPI003CCDC81B
MAQQCTNITNLCNDCRIQYGTVSRQVPLIELICPQGVYPIVFQDTILTYPEQVVERTQALKSRLSSFFGRDIHVHAVIRISNGDPNSPAKWYRPYREETLGLMGTPKPVTNNWSSQIKSPSSGSFADKHIKGGFLMLSGTKAAFQHARTRKYSKVRDVSVLVDFPFAVQAGGEIEHIVVDVLGFGQNLNIEHPNGPCASFVRLNWFAKAYPETAHVGMEPHASSSKKVDAWSRGDCYVRKKKH